MIGFNVPNRYSTSLIGTIHTRSNDHDVMNPGPLLSVRRRSSGHHFPIRKVFTRSNHNRRFPYQWSRCQVQTRMSTCRQSRGATEGRAGLGKGARQRVVSGEQCGGRWQLWTGHSRAQTRATGETARQRLDGVMTAGTSAQAERVRTKGWRRRQHGRRQDRGYACPPHACYVENKTKQEPQGKGTGIAHRSS